MDTPMRRLLAGGALLLAVSLTGCAVGASSATTAAADMPTPAAEPSPTASPSPTALLPAVEWRESPEYETCVEMYRSVDGATNNPRNECALMLRDYEVAELKAAFASPEEVERLRLDLLAQVQPVDPRVEVRFAGSGEATVTWIGSEGNMIQRQVTLPYSDTVPMQDYIGSNVVQIPGSVGCSIVIYNNQHRDGLVLNEVAVVDGQTMAQCSHSF